MSMQDAVGNEWFWEFDSLGRLQTEDDPDAGQWSYTYDSAGRLLTQTDAKSQVTTLAYDALVGRLATKTNPDGTVTYTYGQPRASYKNVGRLTTVTSPADVLQVDYDALGRAVHQLRTLDAVNYEVTRTFDGPSGALSTISYPDADVVGALGYDEAGRVTSIPGIVTSVVYDAAGRPTLQSNANSTSTQWSYTIDRGFLEGIETSGNGGPVQDLAYTYDDAGIVQSVTSLVAGEGWTYGYDDLYRMTTATNTSYPGESQSFTYDTAGRILTNSRVGSYTYPSLGQPRPHAPLTAGAASYTYDPNGNLLSGGGRTIAWNADNLPSQITMGGTTVSVTYDGTGSRIKKTAPSVTSLYPFGDDYEITNGVITKYVSVEGLGVVAKRVGSGGSAVTTWLHGDRLGSITTATNGSGAATMSRTYRPYGETLAASGGSESRGWIDQRNDAETGLTYLHARYYDPQVGTFLSPDRLHPAEAGVGTNRYAYAFGSPVNGTDRTGQYYNTIPCGSPFDAGGEDCGGGGGGYYFILGGGIGYSRGGNPALNEIDQLETRMRNTTTTTRPNPDGSTTTITTDGFGGTTTTTTSADGETSETTFTEEWGGCGEADGNVSCSTNATVGEDLGHSQSASMLLGGGPVMLVRPTFVLGRGNLPVHRFGNFNEGARPVRMSPRPPAKPVHEPARDVRPTPEQMLDQLGPRWGWKWLSFWIMKGFEQVFGGQTLPPPVVVPPVAPIPAPAPEPNYDPCEFMVCA